MATDAEVYRLRMLIAEPTDVLPWTDAALEKILDDAGDEALAAHQIWTAKAAAAADLVNVSEGGSSRSLGDLHEQALAMAKHFGTQVSGGTGPEPRYTQIHRLTR